ncbi:hypothetical protein PhiCh1p61 [Natrialba phage PhiCh1]|uniref:Uncharacterized protein n=1 Tax=Natrialba phage PhiCh1 TaxID=114777 RepID=Q8JKZ6_9CAUD|nr:hypothetical protein PhiCh1p61 [Natrialba phage PhiCh1]AAM88734.1 unknown [Natrialba phage PhiCh1]
MTEKTISGWIVVDWRKGKHRTRQSKPKRPNSAVTSCSRSWRSTSTFRRSRSPNWPSRSTFRNHTSVRRRWRPWTRSSYRAGRTSRTS